MDELPETRMLIGFVPVGDNETIEEYQSLPVNPEELLRLKPATWYESDEFWLISARVFGIVHSWNHNFQDWHERKHKLMAHAVKSLGMAGAKNAHLANRENWEQYVSAMVKTNWPLDDLGEFGAWMIEARIPQRFAQAILKEYLTD